MLNKNGNNRNRARNENYYSKVNIWRRNRTHCDDDDVQFVETISADNVTNDQIVSTLAVTYLDKYLLTHLF